MVLAVPFQECIPVAATPEAFREEVFHLVYGDAGFSFADVLDMTRAERRWFIERLVKKKREEAEAVEEAKRKAKAKGS